MVTSRSLRKTWLTVWHANDCKIITFNFFYGNTLRIPKPISIDSYLDNITMVSSIVYFICYYPWYVYLMAVTVEFSHACVSFMPAFTSNNTGISLDEITNFEYAEFASRYSNTLSVTSLMLGKLHYRVRSQWLRKFLSGIYTIVYSISLYIYCERKYKGMIWA